MKELVTILILIISVTVMGCQMSHTELSSLKCRQHKINLTVASGYTLESDVSVSLSGDYQNARTISKQPHPRSELFSETRGDLFTQREKMVYCSQCDIEFRAFLDKYSRLSENEKNQLLKGAGKSE